MTNRFSNLLLTAASAAMLAACGGGGGGSLRPIPVAPTPSPTPTPAPTPAPSSLNTAEYRRSNAATSIGALTAYEAGAFGAGVKVGVIDSGIDVDSPEFAGRIDPASRSTNRDPLQDIDGHGTSVAGVIAAAANGRFNQGVAPLATIVAQRADDPGSCDGEDGCNYPDVNIAAGIDNARVAGARVINVSLGGSEAFPVLRRAIDRATAADIIIVISSGNDGEDNPDPLALVANDGISRGRVLIAGALTATGQQAEFSNRAGSGQQHYFATLGDRVRSFDHTDTAFLFSGTSYAAPGLSGALALLFSAFPNLSADEAIEILRRSATDLGAAGTDAVFGRGGLDIAAAFRAQGQTSLAGSKIALDAESGALVTFGGAAGDGGTFGDTLGNVVVLDAFGRAYGID
ncbi:MAG: S8 family peptidase, partial [Pacificimonas sp.]